MNPLRYLFIDFDSYFASVEQHLDPSLRGRPVGVVPTMAETTSCIAASYEAKRFGVKTGTRVSEARQLCPGIQFVEAEHSVYVHYHERFHAAIEEVIPITKTLSIDEVCCELPKNWRDRSYVENMMLRVQDNLAHKVSPWITCSLGAGPNRFIAKLASKYRKPNGHHIVEQEDLMEFLVQHQLSDLNGVGRNMEARLKRAGIYTVAQMCQCKEETLRKVWGSVHGARMWHALKGDDLAELQTHTSTIGHSHVLAPERRAPHQALKVLHRLLQKATLRLRDKGYVTSRMQLSLRYDSGLRWGHEARFDETCESHPLRYALSELWCLRPAPHETIRKLSVSFFGLKEKTNYTLNLFSQEDPKREAVDQAMDHIVNKFGKQAAYYGGAHGAQKAVQMRIAFNHIPDLILED